MIMCTQSQIQGRGLCLRWLYSLVTWAIFISGYGLDINIESAFFHSQICPSLANKLYGHISYNQCRTIKSSIAFSTGEITGQKQCFRNISVLTAHKRLREDDRKEEKQGNCSYWQHSRLRQWWQRQERNSRHIPGTEIGSRRKGVCSSS